MSAFVASGITASRTFPLKDDSTPHLATNAQALHSPPEHPPVRIRRDTSSEVTPLRWTLGAIAQLPPGDVGTADRQLQALVGSAALRRLPDKKVRIPPGSSVFSAFDTYRKACNTPELNAWLLTKGMAPATLVFTPHAVSGLVTEDGVTRFKTFTTSDSSGWWRVSARLRAASTALDPEGKGLPHVDQDSAEFSRNAILRFYGVRPPANDSDMARVREELSATDWSAIASEQKTQVEARVQQARRTIGLLDERVHLAARLEALVKDQLDDEAVVPGTLQVDVCVTSPLARGGTRTGNTALLSEVLSDHGLEVPTTVAQVRNVVRWLTSALPPPPPEGDYARLLPRQWAPGALSADDKRFLAQLSDPPAGSEARAFDLLGILRFGNILERNSSTTLRNQAGAFLDQIFSTAIVQSWGAALAGNRGYYGTSGTTQVSSAEGTEWLAVAIMLHVDPDSPGTPGTVAGYDLYQPANSGRTLDEVRLDFENHLKQKCSTLDARAAPLVAHLFLASAAPEFVIRGNPHTLKVGSTEWADLRLGIAFARSQGGAGCERGMDYTEITALSRLDSMTPDQEVLLRNLGVDILLDWGAMQGLYPRSPDGRYTVDQYQQAAAAFADQRQGMVDALKVFNTALPDRRDIAIAQLHKVFPEYALNQLKALKIQIADPDERRNMRLSEPRTRLLIEAYMTGDLSKDRWLLVDPSTPAAIPAQRQTPFSFNRGMSDAEKATMRQKVQALNTRIEGLPGLPGELVSAVDSYLENLKTSLSLSTRQMFAGLEVEDRRALELGDVELFSLRQEVGNTPTNEQTPEQLENGRGRQGTLVVCDYLGKKSFYEVFPAKRLVVKRLDLTERPDVGGVMEDHLKVYGNWAPSTVQVQRGKVEKFDFNAYRSAEAPRRDASTSGIIIEKLGATLPGTVLAVGTDAEKYVPVTFSSTKTRAIVERIMSDNFVHDRKQLLEHAEGKLPLEKKREIAQRNQDILLGMIPFVGALIDFSKGKFVEGTRGLIIDITGALLGGGASAVRGFLSSTKVVAPFGAKVFGVIEKGVSMVSAFINPLDGAADLLVLGSKGVIALPRLARGVSNPAPLMNLVAAQEKLRTFIGVSNGMIHSARISVVPGRSVQAGHNHAIPTRGVQANGKWYAVNPKNGLPTGTPLDGFKLQEIT